MSDCSLHWRVRTAALLRAFQERPSGGGEFAFFYGSEECLLGTLLQAIERPFRALILVDPLLLSHQARARHPVAAPFEGHCFSLVEFRRGLREIRCPILVVCARHRISSDQVFEQVLPVRGRFEVLRNSSVGTGLREDWDRCRSFRLEMKRWVEEVTTGLPNAWIGKVYWPEGFRQMANGIVIPGRSNVPSRMFVSGLRSGGTTWLEVARFLHRMDGTQSQIRPLAHHVRQEDYDTMTSEALVTDLTERLAAARAAGERVALFAHSIACLAAVRAIARCPGTVRAFVAVAPPMVLSDRLRTLFELYQRLAIPLNVLPPRMSQALRRRLEIDLTGKGFDSFDQSARRHPIRRTVSVNAARALADLQREVVRQGRSFGGRPHVPHVLVITGENDNLLGEGAIAKFLSSFTSDDRTVIRIPEAGHSPMAESRPVRRRFRREVLEWLRDRKLLGVMEHR